MTCLNCKHNKILRGKENCKDYQFCLEQKNRNSPDYAKECEFYEPKTNADKLDETERGEGGFGSTGR